MTYPDPNIIALVQAHCVPLRLSLSRTADRAHFRTYRVIWTPTTAILDRRGTLHYQATGFHLPALFAQVLRIGLARTMIAWARYTDAAEQLTHVAEDVASPLAAEALYWLGVARYLPTEDHAAMQAAWHRLQTDHPQSIWAARVPPADV